MRVEASTPLYIQAGSGVKVDENETSKGTENATRIAFITQGTTTAGDTVANIQALKSGTTASRFIWEPNYDVHTSAGVQWASATYGITTSTAGGTALTYSGIKATIPAPVGTQPGVLMIDRTAGRHAGTYSTYFDDVTPSYTTVSSFTTTPGVTNQAIFTLAAGITKVRIYVWIEGQDVDCENAASGSNIDVDLSFTMNATNGG